LVRLNFSKRHLDHAAHRLHFFSQKLSHFLTFQHLTGVSADKANPIFARNMVISPREIPVAY
jgi:hypothetical protein